ncbi:hypothetical protein RIR_jg29571.t2 [Rhizophagus irregularis DAOM 181602=DAOM 197198]|nr:hypothetical protein RIR_jg29571.t2 [Rhizophagus irregularis DAOM 181602=DAOM 197198]
MVARNHRETVGMVTILWPCLCRSIKNLNYFIINSCYYFQFLIFESFLPFSQIFINRLSLIIKLINHASIGIIKKKKKKKKFCFRVFYYL